MTEEQKWALARWLVWLHTLGLIAWCGQESVRFEDVIDAYVFRIARCGR